MSSNNWEESFDTIDLLCLYRNFAGETVGKDVTNILKKITKDYDRKVRPHYGGEFYINLTISLKIYQSFKSLNHV